MKNLKNFNILKIAMIVISIFFVMPSVLYIFKNGTVFNFNGNLEFCFLLTNNIDRLYQAIVYFVVLLMYVIFYSLIIKNYKKIFKEEKKVYKFVFIISLIFVLMIPFWSSDVFYYLGIGRLSSKYHQNPYYVDMKSYIDNNEINIQNDTVIQKGYKNYWSETTVVYGAFWTLICSIISFLSFGNLDFGLLIFKIINLMVHIGNCVLLYKISKKKIFSLIYGLNPFVLIEGIGNVHNDIFIILFMLLSIYALIKKKNIIISLLFLALATDIKYFSVLLLPLIVIYYAKDQKLKKRIICCVLYGGLFFIFAIIPYILYIRDINVFLGLIEQRSRIAKGLYLVITQYFHNLEYLVDFIKTLVLEIFVVIYIFECFTLLFAKKVKFYKGIRKIYLFIIAFLFLIITNFQPWYFMWLIPFIIWQKSDNIRLIIQMQIMTLFANIVFLIYSENYIYGVPFFGILIIGILSCMLYNKKRKIILLKKCL